MERTASISEPSHHGLSDLYPFLTHLLHEVSVRELTAVIYSSDEKAETPTARSLRAGVSTQVAWDLQTRARNPEAPLLCGHSDWARACPAGPETSRGLWGSEVCMVLDCGLLSAPYQERLHGCIRLLQPCSGNLLPAAGHSGAELWLPEPTGRCLRPPRQSQTEAAEARGEPALNRGSLLTLAVTLKSNPSRGSAVLLSGKHLCFTFPGIVLFWGTAVFECLLLLLWIRAGGGCSSGWQT